MNATKSKRIIALLAAIVLSVGLSLAVSASSTTEPPLLGGNLIWNIESIYYFGTLKVFIIMLIPVQIPL